MLHLYWWCCKDNKQVSKVICHRAASLAHIHLCNCNYIWTYQNLITGETPIKLPLSVRGDLKPHPINGSKGTTDTRLTAHFSELPGWAGTRKVKPIWILLKQETVSGSGISWAICKSAPRSRQITMPATHHSVFTGRMPFLPPNQQRQSTEGKYRTQPSP